MHGAGNDYVFIDGFVAETPDNADRLAVRFSDRHTGIGADGLILLLPALNNSYDVEMRMWNADGSTGEMCGNGARCVALWMHLQNRIQQTCRIRTASRVVHAEVLDVDPDAMFGLVVVDMGAAEFDADSIRRSLANVTVPQHSEDSEGLEYTAVSIGNPHAVVFGYELSDRNVRQVGSAIQQHSRFPEGVNVEWVRVDSRAQLTVRVLERGSGETLACGSGACAAVVAAILRGHCDQETDISVNLPGGRLIVRWQSSGTILLTGPASVSFTGDFMFQE
jgi:diaminopimelate epimerase